MQSFSFSGKKKPISPFGVQRNKTALKTYLPLHTMQHNLTIAQQSVESAYASTTTVNCLVRNFSEEEPGDSCRGKKKTLLRLCRCATFFFFVLSNDRTEQNDYQPHCHKSLQPKCFIVQYCHTMEADKKHPTRFIQLRTRMK